MKAQKPENLILINDLTQILCISGRTVAGEWAKKGSGGRMGGHTKFDAVFNNKIQILPPNNLIYLEFG